MSPQGIKSEHPWGFPRCSWCPSCPGAPLGAPRAPACPGYLRRVRGALGAAPKGCCQTMTRYVGLWGWRHPALCHTTSCITRLKGTAGITRNCGIGCKCVASSSFGFINQFHSPVATCCAQDGCCDGGDRQPCADAEIAEAEN